MTSEHNQILNEIENYISDSVSKNTCLSFDDITPSHLVQYLAEDLVKKRFIWLGNETYVPSKLVGTLSLPDADKLEELEVIFSSPKFVNLMNSYISANNFKMFGGLKIELKFGSSEAKDDKFHMEFAWPGAEDAVEDVTVKVDENQGRILEVYNLKPEIPRLARLSLISGEVYRDNYLITRKVTNIGRLRNVIDRETGQLIRRNDFVFARNMDDNSPNNSVSRQHATIKFNNGKFYVHDNGSANGTAIERAGVEPIDVLPGNPLGLQLEHYDIIRFGTALVRFEDNAKIGLSIDKDAVQPQIENEVSGEIQTTIKLTREQIENEMRKLLDSE
jgi:pSer/pThr/pTyr-binding forkhead associated (FHA) protein